MNRQNLLANREQFHWRGNIPLCASFSRRSGQFALALRAAATAVFTLLGRRF
jgi:hypothetical protein